MPICKICNKTFPNRLKIEGKTHTLSNRKYCLDCSPFKEHNTKKLHIDTTEAHRKSLEYQVFRVTKKRKSLAEKAVNYKGGKCQICGYNKCNRALEFHHIDPSTKKFGVKSGNTHSWDLVKQEADKCVLLCSNCHRELEDGLITLNALQY